MVWDPVAWKSWSPRKWIRDWGYLRGTRFPIPNHRNPNHPFLPLADHRSMANKTLLKSENLVSMAEDDFFRNSWGFRMCWVWGDKIKYQQLLNFQTAATFQRRILSDKSSLGKHPSQHACGKWGFIRIPLLKMEYRTYSLCSLAAWQGPSCKVYKMQGRKFPKSPG